MVAAISRCRFSSSVYFAKAAASAWNPNLNYWTPTAYTNGKVFFNMGGGSFVRFFSV